MLHFFEIQLSDRDCEYHKDIARHVCEDGEDEDRNGHGDWVHTYRYGDEDNIIL